MAEALSLLGGCLRNNGDYDSAETHLIRALELREEIFGPKHLEVAETLTLWACCTDRPAGSTRPKRSCNAHSPFTRPSWTERCPREPVPSNPSILAAQQGRAEEAEPIFRRVSPSRKRSWERITEGRPGARQPRHRPQDPGKIRRGGRAEPAKPGDFAGPRSN